MNWLIFDIETIPDTALGRRLYGLGDLPDAQVARAMFAQSAPGGADEGSHSMNRVHQLTLGALATLATYVVGVDPVESKRDSAKFFGATHTAASAQEAIPLVKEITLGLMADRVVICPGVVHADLIPSAMALLRKGGICVLTGITPYTEPPVPLVLQEMTLSAKQLRGALYGGMNPRTSVPMLLSLYQAGALKLDELVTRHYQLDEINEAFVDLREGRNIRGMIDFAGF